MTLLNLILFVVVSIILFLSIQYALRIRDRYYKLKISETKLEVHEKKINKERQELAETKKRLEAQKAPLDKKWNEIQNGQEILDEKSLKLQKDRELYEKRRSELNHQQVEIEEKLKKIENLNRNFELKWKHEKQEFEKKRNELREFLRQISLEKTDLDVQKNQLIREKQKFEDEKRKLSKRLSESELLKMHYERQKSEILKEKSNLQEEEKRFKEEKKKIEKEKEEIKRIRREILNERDDLQKQNKELIEKEKILEGEVNWIKNEKEKIEQSKLEIKNVLRQLTIDSLKQIKETKEKKRDGEIIPAKRPLLVNDFNLRAIDNGKNITRLIPEIVCWKQDKYWKIGIGISGDLANNLNVEIIQENIRLEKEGAQEKYWTLKSMSPVLIKWYEVDKPTEKIVHINDGFETPLLFKLKRQINTIGKLVRYPSHGKYLVIVPENWQRDERLSGTASFEPEDISIADLKGHFFNLRENSDVLIAFRKSDGISLSVAPQSSRFYLAGSQVINENEEKGPLFGDKLPIITDKFKSWNNIETVIVGEEGEGVRKLRWAFKPDHDSPELDLNQAEERGDVSILRSDETNFSVNIYDKNDTLLESMDFRYIQGLKTIETSEYPILPGSNGHPTVNLNFLHDQSCKINLMRREKNNRNMVMTSHDKGTFVNILPDPSLDITDWLIVDGIGREVEIKIKLMRVWWKVINESDIPQKKNATDKLFELSLQHFNAISKLRICIWLPEFHHLRKIFIGFGIDKRKSFFLNNNESVIFIPLREFIGEDNFQSIPGKRQLKLWLNEEKDEYATIVELNPCLLYCKLKNCDFKTSDEEEMISHIKVHHISDLVKELDYNEIRSKYNLDWPVEIYQCGYCNFYINSDNKTGNPTTSIIKHIQQCSKAMSKNGTPFISFKIVNDVHEIRKLVNPEIPVVHKCVLCEKYFENQSDEEILNHLIRVHKKDLITEKT